ncbi:Dad3 protein [Maudiozyma humilis]|uniref:DASH complex subunit DAD3 n=1 Tax=Maudiozyma humilis TaxID=51915 RepID=A0AAV5S4J2_MAUHU|nr:Dad3 protein [Kazachstania humilis]
MHEKLTPLQQSVLERYGELAAELRRLDGSIKALNRRDERAGTPQDVLDEVRELEVKLALIGTLLKGSVYSYVSGARA